MRIQNEQRQAKQKNCVEKNKMLQVQNGKNKYRISHSTPTAIAKQKG